MFLAGFEYEKKYLFRELAIYAASADDNFCDEEKMIIDAFCAEMRIDNNNYLNDISYEDTLSKIKDTFSRQEIRMSYLEIMSVLLADNTITEMENLFIEDISEQFNMSKDEVSEAKEALLSLKATYKMMSEFIAK